MGLVISRYTGCAVFSQPKAYTQYTYTYMYTHIYTHTHSPLEIDVYFICAMYICMCALGYFVCVCVCVLCVYYICMKSCTHGDYEARRRSVRILFERGHTVQICHWL